MRMPPNIPGMVIVQHMPAQFTASFAERLDSLSPIRVREAEDGDSVLNGQALIAPGNFHMVLEAERVTAILPAPRGPDGSSPEAGRGRPFQLRGQVCWANATGVILTGMGADGAQGMREMKQAGAKTIAQDEGSCVVFGMPKEAIKLGAVDRVVSLDRIPQEIIHSLQVA